MTRLRKSGVRESWMGDMIHPGEGHHVKGVSMMLVHQFLSPVDLKPADPP